MDHSINNEVNRAIFNNFIKDYSFTEYQANQFQLYLSLLLKVRQNFNLTALATIDDIINYHFKDSLELAQALNLNEIKSLADVGTGGGFPGIPIKIAYPHLSLFLIEVNLKKIDFLKNVCQTLELDHCEFSSLDWRTFLRTTTYSIDYFIARASLQPDELLRMFQPSSFYKEAGLIYWASRHWHQEAHQEPFFVRDYSYSIQGKQRKLIFFNRKSH